jgi:hypothetical protein
MKYYIVWIEGFGYKDGEKVKSLTDTGFSYTTKMTEAIRIREKDIPFMLDYMKRHGIADWVINSPNTFIRTSYVPKGSLLKVWK